MAAAQDLLEWYQKEARDLPWRRTSDAYAVWVSEVMLQQTRVDVVIPYYERFMARFPSLPALAAADLAEVLGLWTGLGYYRRARQLHAAARQIVEAGGELPRTAAAWRLLPGIGDYTASAIASIAGAEDAVALDTNVRRVLARRGRLTAAPASARGATLLKLAAAELFAPGKAGLCNQALMELGALVCTPRQPHCERCPIAFDCEARRAGDQELYPPRQRRRPAVLERRVAAVVGDGPRLLLVRRPAASRSLAGTWELPWTAATPEAAQALAERYGGLWRLGPSLGTVRHQITFRRIELDVCRAELVPSGAVAEGGEAGWFDRDQIAELPRSSLLAKAVALAARSSAVSSDCC